MQSDSDLEREFINLLCEQGYTYLAVHSEKDLLINLRTYQRLRMGKFFQICYSFSNWKQDGQDWTNSRNFYTGNKARWRNDSKYNAHWQEKYTQ